MTGWLVGALVEIHEGLHGCQDCGYRMSGGEVLIALCERHKRESEELLDDNVNNHDSEEK